MPITLSLKAIEEGTYGLECVFTDELGTIIVPSSSIAWTLTDEFGTVVNSRLNVMVAAAGTIDIVLYGDDLAMPNPEFQTRLITVETTYSSNLGSGLPLKDQARFSIDGLRAVP